MSADRKDPKFYRWPTVADDRIRPECRTLYGDAFAGLAHEPPRVVELPRRCIPVPLSFERGRG